MLEVTFRIKGVPTEKVLKTLEKFSKRLNFPYSIWTQNNSSFVYFKTFNRRALTELKRRFSLMANSQTEILKIKKVCPE